MPFLLLFKNLWLSFKHILLTYKWSLSEGTKGQLEVHVGKYKATLEMSLSLEFHSYRIKIDLLSLLRHHRKKIISSSFCSLFSAVTNSNHTQYPTTHFISAFLLYCLHSSYFPSKCYLSHHYRSSMKKNIV